MTAGVPQPVKGTKFEFKATSGGTFAEVINCMARRIPTPQAETEDFTPIGAACVGETNQINDYGDLELEIVYDRTDPVHAALLANVGSRTDCYWKITTADLYVITFNANSKQFGDKNAGPRNNCKADFKAHCNTVPVVTGP